MVTPIPPCEGFSLGDIGFFELRAGNPLLTIVKKPMKSSVTSLQFISEHLTSMKE